ncbi:MAG: acyl-CoA dehydratase activase, partial [Spirochaetales bacterium]|nr:acyl-CoA dehydratase activase [Spirochaetales bacterium]
MSARDAVLGVDVGSVALSCVVAERNGTIRGRHYAIHEGDIARALRDMERGLDLAGVTTCALTGRSAHKIQHDHYVESRLACIRSVKGRYPEARAILLVGGEFFSLIRLDAEGRYESVRTNTSCAAGTGSFLDQQAGRLNMVDSAELSATALRNADPVPLVATRCAVFAKTDLIHAQQEGYSLSGIAEGLCVGLARNLVDTLFKDADMAGPVLFTGGVAQNEAVARHVDALVPHRIIVDTDGPFQGAIGAALSLLDALGGIGGADPACGTRPLGVVDTEGEAAPHPAIPADAVGCEGVIDRDAIEVVGGPRVVEDLSDGSAGPRAVTRFRPHRPDRSGFYPPLTLRHSDYPSFAAYRRYEQNIEGRPGQPLVEVDLYRPWPPALDAYLGVDIGSTSTKAVITDLQGEVLGGFYTRTAGRPLSAAQALFEAIEVAADGEQCTLAIHGSATTGSGRKFIGEIIHADEILDEISAHARAACALDPRVDTILEIGGQDAKFTTLKHGRVTLSVMNNVCAAGTGSFLEEQAKRLGVAVSDYAERTADVRAPRVSDRCTVFMERDINHLLSEGHTVPEVLAAALHAVRENYLHKVAVEKSIGDVVFFQGATAKNRSLVAAFEQRLNRPILVSPYCHLTGALGAALTLADRGVVSDAFAGLNLHRHTIPVRREVCGLCANHCKLSVVEVDGRTSAFGFLCGRDYGTERYVDRNTSGFDLLAARRAVERALQKEVSSDPVEKETVRDRATPPTIGLPDGLFMTEDLAYWQVFFRALGIATKTGRRLKNPIQRGKPLVGAEFCAPISALHGRAAALLKEVDYLFLPTYLERKPEKGGALRKFCYFSQFAAPLIRHIGDDKRILTPLAATRYSSFHLLGELHKALSVLTVRRPTLLKISSALERADAFRRDRARSFKALYREYKTAADTVDVVLLGRPYSVLPKEMNKGIPDIFASLGVRVFYQDMIDYEPHDVAAIEPLLREVNWAYGAKILEAAEVAARTPGLYPVFLTSFKCGPDSFITEYVRRILDAHDKPYLILELDEHDSAVGYETRIEAAIRSFRNHIEDGSAARGVPAEGAHYRGVNPRYARELTKDKTLVIPNWDDYSIPLIAAVLNGQGYRTLIMEETDETIRRSLRWNNGQCIPMNALVEGYVATINNRALAPERCLLWIPMAAFSCNIRLFPHHVQEILKGYGDGMDRAGVYLGDMTYTDLSPVITANAYLAYMFSGLIRRIACRIRPYEHNPGDTDGV